MDQDLFSIAIHEAGHAVAAFAFDIRFLECSVDPENRDGVVETGDIDYTGATLDRMKQHCIMYLAAWEAQLLHETDLNEAAHEFSLENDRANAKNCVMFAVAEPNERAEMYEQCRLAARDFVRDNWDKIERVGKKLYESRVLTYDEVAALIGTIN